LCFKAIGTHLVTTIRNKFNIFQWKKSLHIFENKKFKNFPSKFKTIMACLQNAHKQGHLFTCTLIIAHKHAHDNLNMVLHAQKNPKILRTRSIELKSWGFRAIWIRWNRNLLHAMPTINTKRSWVKMIFSPEG
jgi:hypothetical protein